MPRLKPNTVMPSREEDAAINQAIASDSSSPELSARRFPSGQSARDVHPDVVEDWERRTRGQQKAPLKVPVSIRLSPDVVNHFRQGGEGWQTRLDNVLKDYVAKHSH